MSVKLKIDFQLGTLDIEGSEEFVKSIYDDFKERLHSYSQIKPKVNDPSPNTLDFKKDEAHTPPNQSKKQTKSKSSAKPSGPKSTSKKIPTLLKDLDLFGGTGGVSLKAFLDRYVHKTNFERNLIFVYFLKNILNLNEVTLDHIFTCYRHTGLKVPKALEQSIRDTGDKGWIDMENFNDIKLPIAGLNHLEHDLEKVQ